MLAHAVPETQIQTSFQTLPSMHQTQPETFGLLYVLYASRQAIDVPACHYCCRPRMKQQSVWFQHTWFQQVIADCHLTAPEVRTAAYDHSQYANYRDTEREKQRVGEREFWVTFLWYTVTQWVRACWWCTRQTTDSEEQSLQALCWSSSETHLWSV